MRIEAQCFSNAFPSINSIAKDDIRMHLLYYVIVSV